MNIRKVTLIVQEIHGLMKMQENSSRFRQLQKYNPYLYLLNRLKRNKESVPLNRSDPRTHLFSVALQPQSAAGIEHKEFNFKRHTVVL